MITFILLFVLILCTFLLFIQFLGYPLLMAFILASKKAKTKKDYNYKPFISVIVPTYNEQKVIAKRINNLLSQDYPSDQFEILIVDSGSKDDTVTISREFEKQCPNIQVIEEGKRNGKASAINLGKKSARGDIVLVTDANDIFNDGALKEIVPHFKNPTVGAVGGRFILTNGENSLVSSSSFYWDIESLVRRGESKFDSACLFHGEINAWRKNIVNADRFALSEDLDMAVQIRKQGYKIAYEPDAIAYEPGPTTKNEQITQKKRTTLGTIQCYFKHKDYLWFPHDKYSGIIFPLHKVFQIYSPFFLLGILLTLIALIVLGVYIAPIIYSVIVIIMFSISFFILDKKLSLIRISQRSQKGSIYRNIFNILYYVLLHEFIILLAWKDFIMRKYSVTWQKAETTRK